MHRVLSSSRQLLIQSISNQKRHLQSTASCLNVLGQTVLTPDIPNDTSESNYLLRLPRNDESIDFKKVNPQQLFRAFLKSLIELDASYEHFSKNNFKEFDEIVAYLDSYLLRVDYTWAMLFLMTNLNYDQYKLRKNSLSRCLQHLEVIREKRFKELKLYDLLVEWDQKVALSDTAKRTWLDSYLKKAQLNGMHLEKKRSQTNQLLENIRKNETQFVENVYKSSASFQHTVLDPEMIKKLPYNLRHANKDGKSLTVTLDQSTVNYFLENCSSERDRWNVWQANNSKASMAKEQKESNNVIIDELRHDKRKLAQTLGFHNYVEYALQDKMATSTDTVVRFVNELHKNTRESYNNDLQSLLRFAADCKEFTSNYMNLWDVPYFVNLTKQYEFRMENVRSYFPFSSVLSGLFKFLSDRFDIKVILDEKDGHKAWAERVRLYRLVHKNQIVGSFYLDPYADVREVLVHQLIGRSQSEQTKPIFALLLNCRPPVSNEKTLLDFKDVVVLFRSFGHLLQQLLSQQPYLELNGLNAFEKDATLLNSELFSLFPIHCYETLANCSEHVVNGSRLPIEVHEQLKEFWHKFESVHLTNELYKTYLDLALHIQSEHWFDIANEVWKQYMQPFKLEKKNQHVCSWTDVICGIQSGSYYANQWNKALAADIFEAYQQSSDKSRTLQEYTDKVLLTNNQMSFRQRFVDFRNRDPILNSYLQLTRLGVAEKPILLFD